MSSTIQEATYTAERRIAPRRQPAFGTICKFTPASDLKPRTGLVWNLSTTGVSMLLHEPCAAGTQLSGELRTVDERIALPVGIRVAARAEAVDRRLPGRRAIRESLSTTEMGHFVDSRREMVGA